MDRHLTIEMTHKCNHNCFYCYNHYRNLDSKDYITFEEVKDLLEQIFYSKIDKNLNRTLVFSGGEPTLNMDVLIKSLYYADFLKNKTNLNINFNVNTNATNINKIFIKSLQDTKTSLFISLISYDKNVYNTITESDNYNIFIKNLKKLKNKVEYCGNYVANIKNYKNLENDINSFFEFGFYNISTSFAYGPIEGFFNKEQYNEYLQQCFNVKQKYKNDFGFSLTLNACCLNNTLKELNGITFHNCSFLNTMLALSPSAKYIGCCRNIFNIELENKKYDEIIEIFKNLKNILKPLPNECKDCKSRILCYGLCGHETQIKNNDKRLQNLLYLLDTVYNENDFLNICEYYKKYDRYPLVVEYVHENLYYIWEVINNFRKAIKNEIYN